MCADDEKMLPGVPATPFILCYELLNGTGDTAIDPDVLTSDICCAIRQEEGHSLSNFVGRAVTTHWDTFEELLFFRKAIDEAG